jgi:NAD(P)-dependent dehydrogenase (short-subunit alcohol dehydrogenase family)
MQPKSESTRLEGPDGLVEYKGAEKLKNKKAIITGGEYNPIYAFLIPSSGIGRSVAILYAREGADVTIVYLPEEQKDADETKSLVEKEGRQCLTIPFDLKDLKNVDKIVQKHLEKFGALDIVVNNASRQLMCKKFEEIDLGV